MRRIVLFPFVMGAAIATNAADQIQLTTLDPGHFHAALVQKSMYPQVSPVVHVYAPDSHNKDASEKRSANQDLTAHLQRIQDFNTRADNPTHWEEKVYCGDDFLKRMIQEHAGNVVVI